MAFERTELGQANRALFFDADLTCYVEGASDAEHGVDIAFWNTIFEALAPRMKVHFTSRGGKPNLEALALGVVNNDIKNVIVAMDRDFSDFRDSGITDDYRVFYTFGYSWENDVYCKDNLTKIASCLSRAHVLPAEHCVTLEDDAFRLDNISTRFVFADFVAVQKGGSLFDRKRPGRYIKIGTDGRPELCAERARADLQSAIRDLKGHVCMPSKGYPREGSRFLWGKAYEHYFGICLKLTVRACSGRVFTSDHMRDVAIVLFCQHLLKRARSVVFDHYMFMWDRFVAARVVR